MPRPRAAVIPADTARPGGRGEVLLSNELADAETECPLGELIGRLRHDAPGATVRVVPQSELERRYASARFAEQVVVDIAPRADPDAVLEHVTALVVAALARLGTAPPLQPDGTATPVGPRDRERERERDRERVLTRRDVIGFSRFRRGSSTRGYDGDLGAAGRGLSELARAVRRSDRLQGVAIACADADDVPRAGDPWLPCRVPSMAAVTVGWLLSLEAAGASTRLVPCASDPCRKRARDLDATYSLFNAVPRAVPRAQLRDPRARSRDVELEEPRATVSSLRALGMLAVDGPQWLVAGPGCSVGMIQVDPDPCTTCGACATACTEGALTVGSGRESTFQLLFDASACGACGRCLTACPEEALTLRRCVDSAALAVERQPRVLLRRELPLCGGCGAPLFAGVSAVVLPGRFVDEGHESGRAGSELQLCADCRLSRPRAPTATTQAPPEPRAPASTSSTQP